MHKTFNRNVYNVLYKGGSFQQAERAMTYLIDINICLI